MDYVVRYQRRCVPSADRMRPMAQFPGVVKLDRVAMTLVRVTCEGDHAAFLAATDPEGPTYDWKRMPQDQGK
ncbi:hypothetical protein H1O16_gp289 [Burkholderia phage BcepSaruman]|uniref:Uncharacterized protein n=1 Tax=Burkholderia phage BcepSaruman TaxID=2530032 RepID=A0A4D5ZGR7_9CAUD|nr:hypothetical protein H1O16_gp289 [Burkholderia phage BcepSaruman]QBX06702.1 hypothetical protein BcepSaruman_289 [Burkholderia phage BcepSaruman]